MVNLMLFKFYLKKKPCQLKINENKEIHERTHTRTQHAPPSNFPFALQNNKPPISGIIQAEAEWSSVSNMLLKG